MKKNMTIIEKMNDGFTTARMPVLVRSVALKRWTR